MGIKVLIVGGVAGGASAAARLRRLNEDAEIIIFERSSHISYANCGLPYYVGGVIENEDDLTLATPGSFNSRFNITARVRQEVIAIDPEAKKVSVKKLDDGSVYEESYDKLILSPGAVPAIPKLPGADLPELFTLRTVEDTLRMREYCVSNKPKTATVVGGGYIGIEIAENLRHLGIEVTIIQRPLQLLRTLDTDMAELIHSEMRKNGVNLMLGSSVSGFEKTENGIKTLIKDNEPVLSDMVILAIGVVPDTKLAKDAGLALGAKDSILVNEYMETSKPDIYAVGDAVTVTHFVAKAPVLIALAGPANKQGRIAADNICGIKSTYKGTQGTSIIKVFSLTCATTGLCCAGAERAELDFEYVLLTPNSHAGYYPGAKSMTMKVIFEKNTGRLLGAAIIGKEGVDKRIDVLATAIRAGLSGADLAELELAYAPPFSSAKDPVNMAGFIIENVLSGIVSQFDTETLEALPRDGSVFLLDVRTDCEYEQGHVDGFVNLPVDNLRERISEIPKDKPVYVMCHSGIRSYIACRILTANGVEAYNYAGGWGYYSRIRGKINPLSQRITCAAEKGLSIS